jgi:hypothetical protein
MYVHMLVEPKIEYVVNKTTGEWRLKALSKYFPREIGQTIQIAHPYFFADNHEYKSEYHYRNCDIVCRSGDVHGGHYVSCGLRRIPNTDREGWYFYSDLNRLGPMGAIEMLSYLRRNGYLPRSFLFRLESIDGKKENVEFENINRAKERHVDTLSYINGEQITGPVVLIKHHEPKPEPDNSEDEFNDADEGTNPPNMVVNNKFGHRRVMSRADFVRAYCNRKRCSKEYALQKYRKAMSVI